MQSSADAQARHDPVLESQIGAGFVQRVLSMQATHAPSLRQIGWFGSRSWHSGEPLQARQIPASQIGRLAAQLADAVQWDGPSTAASTTPGTMHVLCGP
jgi:hypothetical protein